MDIDLKRITVRELVEGYEDNGDYGVRGYGGKLDIRPPYQREFVYDDKQRNAVIDSILNGFPLNVMYWSDKGDGEYEIIDGQQRTISIAQFVHRIFSVEFASMSQIFTGLPSDIQNRILEYELMVYVCSGTDSEKLDWYRTINIAGETLYEQEIRNAVYAGPWVSDARSDFSKRGCRAFLIGKDYLSGSSIRQDYLETAIKWISDDQIEDYMSRHQHDENAAPLWQYFRAVIDWIEATFTTKRKYMKGVDWGTLYNNYGDAQLDPACIEAEIVELLDDKDVMESGIYAYIITRNRRHIYRRTFEPRVKRRVYKKQEGICNICKDKFKIQEMEADHIKPWSEGGKSNEENCQLLCRKCNREKSSK